MTVTSCAIFRVADDLPITVLVRKEYDFHTAEVKDTHYVSPEDLRREKKDWAKGRHSTYKFVYMNNGPTFVFTKEHVDSRGDVWVPHIPCAVCGYPSEICGNSPPGH